MIREIEKNIQGRSLYTLGEEVAASHDEAIRIIKDERGKHFDSHIIDVFMDIQDELKG